jgi:CxxC motif-containing protein (DUF1111 family)
MSAPQLRVFRSLLVLAATALVSVASGCDGHGPIAEHVMAPLGQPVPYATDVQLATFARGQAVAQRRFAASDGLGPAFNVTFCGSCHERPTLGGSAGHYRDFFLAGWTTEDGAFLPAESAGDAGGVVRLYAHEDPARPTLDEDVDVIARRNPIPFYGVGLLAEVAEDELLKRSDPEDSDGDGISGRPNYDRGFVGRFGRKAQTVSIEGFIRGPLFNHLGVTSDPLTDDQKAALPVDSSQGSSSTAQRWFRLIREAHAQVAAPDGPLTDDDGVPDPELSTDDLFDLVSMSMLMAAPLVEELSEQAERGRDQFDAAGCGDCHAPRLKSPRGQLPVYSDLLLHDMGPDLADGIVMGEATGAEFRTQPLWGLAAVGPYLHDGRATTVAQAIRLHAGEGQTSADAWEALDSAARDDLLEFLASLGGRDQYSPGLIPPGEPAPAAGDWGGPLPGLPGDDQARFEAGRLQFDREFGVADGVGGPRLNGDSCRACHFEPAIGGAGPRGTDVMRHGLLDDAGEFMAPAVGTIIHRTTSLVGELPRPESGAVIFEARQTPHVFGAGLVDAIEEAVIVAGADPDDVDADGISGRVSWTDGDRVGRFGWKAQVPSLAEFVRDAAAAELGMTLPAEAGLTFGATQDDDGVADPELSQEHADRLVDFLGLLAPPPRSHGADAVLEAEGEGLFVLVGCADCHTPALEGPDGPVPLYSDLLLHEILPPAMLGIEDTSAGMHEFRTAPLWGLAGTAPYLHDGSAETPEQAILGHAGEGSAARDAFSALPPEQRSALEAFLSSL